LTGRLVAGVDGCREGWVAVVLSEGRFHEAIVARTLPGFLHEYRNVRAVGVDMPIGLPLSTPGRRADGEAKTFLGTRAKSVFPIPPREVLEEEDHNRAVKIAQRLIGHGISQQTHALRKKIFEIEDFVSGTRLDVREVHPEVSFRGMNEEPLGFPKRAWDGLLERKRLLAREGIKLPEPLGGEAGRVQTDDLLDAAAAAWSADRIARDTACSLPSPPEIIAGQKVAIWY